ncbi:hypothetical protein K469DRAFT_90126 [Zopfia rhizophila CBS 207.26]|uniref:Uncharacterized protein n=1 Tax=Zopfia rhizophila CBS 207.26 TaxID=1314779 RepID=A0A6A6EE60_9PEZI|nr:hypothetical protein K469DRAFT_90126 [Zopfia rhizophila CBS 207.26]
MLHAHNHTLILYSSPVISENAATSEVERDPKPGTGTGLLHSENRKRDLQKLDQAQPDQHWTFARLRITDSHRLEKALKFDLKLCRTRLRCCFATCPLLHLQAAAVPFAPPLPEPQASCHTIALKGITNSSTQIAAEQYCDRETLEPRLIACSSKSSSRFTLRPLTGTERVTCINDGTSDRQSLPVAGLSVITTKWGENLIPRSSIPVCIFKRHNRW